jgi:hypothetical protein
LATSNVMLIVPLPSRSDTYQFFKIGFEQAVP